MKRHVKNGGMPTPYFGSQSINLYPRARVLILGLKKHPTGGVSPPTRHILHSIELIMVKYAEPDQFQE